MPRLDTFKIRVKTGAKGIDHPPHFIINGFPLEFEEISGGTGPGETFEATGAPGSFPHSLLLQGPEHGEWEIESLEVTYFNMNEDPYTIRFGAVTLDAESDVNIYHERPAPVLDV
jgi:hypothetical protein